MKQSQARCGSILSRENNAYTNQLRRRDHLHIRRAVLIEIIDMFDSDILPDDMSYVSTAGRIKHQSTTLIGEIAGRKLQPQSSRVVERLGSWKIDPFFFLPFKDIKGSIKKSLHHSFALDLVPLLCLFSFSSGALVLRCLQIGSKEVGSALQHHANHSRG